MPGQPNRRDRERREENQRRHAALRAMRDEWVRKGIVEHGLSPEDALQRLVDDSMFRYLETVMVNDQRRAAGEIVDDRRERKLSDEASKYQMYALQYGLDKRRLEIDERRTDLMLFGLQLICARLGIGAEEFKQVPGMLRTALSEYNGLSPDDRQTMVRKAQAEAEQLPRRTAPRPGDIEAA
jgi:hypothetical protein